MRVVYKLYGNCIYALGLSDLLAHCTCVDTRTHWVQSTKHQSWVGRSVHQVAVFIMARSTEIYALNFIFLAYIFA